MTGTSQATRTDPGMVTPVTGEMRSGRGWYDFNDGIRYSTIKGEKIPDDNDAVRTAKASASASASASKAASGRDRGRNKNNKKNDKRKIRREKDISEHVRQT